MGNTTSTTVHGSFATFTLRIERSQLERIRAIAISEHRTVNQEVRRMIEQRIAAEDTQATS